MKKRRRESRPKPLGKPPTVAFIGLGAMGLPMAARLEAAGFDVRRFNRSPRAGVTLSRSPREAATGASTIVLMLPDAAALRRVLRGPRGVLAAVAAGRESRGARGASPVVIDMSTSGRAAAREAAAMVEEAGGRFLDVPVSGSVGPATRGELLGMVGGAARDLARARPVLDVLCNRIVHAGGVGQGQALKVVLNGIGAHHFVGFASMMALGERAGLKRDVLLDAITGGAFATPSYRQKRDKVARRDYSPDFALALALKDAFLVKELEGEVGAQLPVVHALYKEIRAAVADGLGDKDLFGIEERYRTRAR